MSENIENHTPFIHFRRITCTTLNAAPTTTPDVLTTPQDTPLVILGADLAANDLDLDGDLLLVDTLPSVTAQGGTLVAGGGGSWTYTPPAGFTGQDLFTYSVADAHGGSATGSVTIDVTVAWLPTS